jgi:hypothetical protein
LITHAETFGFRSSLIRVETARSPSSRARFASSFRAATNSPSGSP